MTHQDSKRPWAQLNVTRLAGLGLVLPADARSVDAHPPLRYGRVPYAGDSILMIGGQLPVEVFRAAIVHQALFRVWPYGSMTVKTTIGYGEFVIEQDDKGVMSHHGTDLDVLYGICSHCPPGGVVVSQACAPSFDSAPTRCHSFVTGGRIQFLDDCTRDMKGKTVTRPDWPRFDH